MSSDHKIDSDDYWIELKHLSEPPLLLGFYPSIRRF